MTNFYVHICANGHVRIDFRRARPEQRCDECGAEVIDSCPECGHLIRKWYYYGSVPRGPRKEDYTRPERCEHCGSLFPWADR